MRRGVYTVTFDQQTIASASGDYDFFELDAAADKPVEIVALDLSNKSEVGDAAEEMVAYSIVRGNTTSGNGTTTTPRPLDPSDGAASFAAEVVSSTPASAGTAISLVVGTFNIRGRPAVRPTAHRARRRRDNQRHSLGARTLRGCHALVPAGPHLGVPASQASYAHLDGATAAAGGRHRCRDPADARLLGHR
jgi:hypothetical protein